MCQKRSKDRAYIVHFAYRCFKLKLSSYCSELLTETLEGKT